MKYRTWFLLGCVCLLGCDEKTEAEAKTEQEAETAKAEQSAAQAVPTQTPEEKAAAAAARAAAERKRKEEAKEQEKVEANPLTECCRALGKRGFTQRSPEYMKASKACGKALEAEETPAQALPGIKKALKGKGLPSECSE